MAEKWTEQQIRAFSSYGHNILVSAGAGSGKTAVLSERVYRHVAERHIDVDRLLVLTFTNKAADEMKDRIRKKIEKDEGCFFASEEEKQRQLNKLDSASIMTFDAYALSLIRKYHYLFDIDKDISVIENNVLDINTERILDEIMEEHYLQKDEDFLILVGEHCVKNDDVIRNALIDLNRKLEMIYERREYVSEYEKNFYSPEALEASVEEYAAVLRNAIASIREKVNRLSQYVENIEDYFRGLDPLFVSRTFEEICMSLENAEKTSGRLPNGSDEEAKDLKKKIAAELDSLKEKAISRQEARDEILLTRNDAEVMLKLADELDARLHSFKKECGLYSFIDIFKMAIELVDRYPEIRRQLSEDFVEILIDEYQDTNDLQEGFIERIAHGNVYMVGDIKQSIYRFRNANPDIFREKYDRYLTGEGGELLELPHNFRSLPEVLDDINAVFDRNMDSRIGGADYRKAHHLLAGRNEEQIPGQNNHLELLTYEYDKKDPAFKGLNRNEFEMFAIARDIKEKMDKPFMVRDKDGLRKAGYGDFCIIVDRTTNFDEYKQILTWFNIPSVIERDEKMNDSDLITVIRALFRLLACISSQDFGYDFRFACVSLARSFLLEYPDSEIYDMVKNETYQETDFCQKLLNITEDISAKTVSSLLDELIEAFDIYGRIIRIGDVRENMIKIDYLYQLAHSLSAAGYDYRDFDEYLEKVFENGNDERDIRYSIDTGSADAVRIINIHKAKGLEYSICYYPGLSVDFNTADLKQRFKFTKELGLILPAYIEGYGLKDTIKKDIFAYRYALEDTAERIRLFYVALTRCRDKMIIVCPLKYETYDEMIIPEYSRLKYRCFADLLSAIGEDLSRYTVTLDPSAYELGTEYRQGTGYRLVLPETDETIVIPKLEKIEPVKIVQSGYSKDSGLISEKAIANMELGTRLHYYLETLDFRDPDLSFIEEEYRPKIAAFLNCDLMKEAGKGKAYKEYEFVYEEEGNRRHGFIDLLMEYEDHFDIIDYKFMNIDDPHYDEQLNGYRRYIEAVSNRKVNCYLYSIMNERYREVKR